MMCISCKAINKPDNSVCFFCNETLEKPQAVVGTGKLVPTTSQSDAVIKNCHQQLVKFPDETIMNAYRNCREMFGCSKDEFKAAFCRFIDNRTEWVAS